MANPLDGDLEQEVIIKVTTNTEQAKKGIKELTKVSINEHGEISRTVTQINEKTGERTRKLYKENELFVNKLGDLAKKYSAGLLAAGLAAKGFQTAFELAVGAAKRAGDEGSKRFLAAYDEMGKATERFKDAVGMTLMPALTGVAKMLARIADTVGSIVANRYVQKALEFGIGSLPGGAGSLLGGPDFSGAFKPTKGYALSAGIRGGLGKFASGMEQAYWIDYLNRITPGVSAQMQQGASDAVWEGERDYLRRLNGGRGGGRGSRQLDTAGRGAAMGAYGEYQRLGQAQAEAERRQREQNALDYAEYGERAAAARDRSKATGATWREDVREAEERFIAIEKMKEEMAIAQRDSMFESMFGTPQELHLFAEGLSAIEMAAMAAAPAFGLLQTAVTSAFDAWITGQESIGKAVKAAVAEGLRAVALQSSVEALKNTAFGVAALATGPIGGVSATTFFKAAGLHAGVAVAAGIGAKALGAGAVGASGAVGAGASVAGIRGGGGGGPADRNVTIILSDSWGEDTPRARRARLNRAIAAAVDEGDR